MAQRIWLMRHGKSSRPFGVVDHERPLSKRGREDAALTRDWLADAPRLFVASTAKRALETASLLAGQRPVVTHPALYEASGREFLAVVEEMLAQCNRVAFVGHNPTTTHLINSLAGRRVADSVPTLGVAAFGRAKPADDWTLAAYVVPKALRAL